MAQNRPAGCSVPMAWDNKPPPVPGGDCAEKPPQVVFKTPTENHSPCSASTCVRSATQYRCEDFFCALGERQSQHEERLESMLQVLEQRLMDSVGLALNQHFRETVTQLHQLERARSPPSARRSTLEVPTAGGLPQVYATPGEVRGRGTLTRGLSRGRSTEIKERTCSGGIAGACRPIGEMTANSSRDSSLGSVEAPVRGHSPRSSNFSVIAIPSTQSSVLSTGSWCSLHSQKSSLPEHWSRTLANRLLKNRSLQAVITSLILLSALSIGIQADWAMRHATRNCALGPIPIVFDSLDIFFTVAFALELLLRVVSEWRFFLSTSNKYVWWNLFDTFVVATSLADDITKLLWSSSMDFSAIRLLRMLRLARVIRIIRLMRFLRDLRIMVGGILGSLKSLMWALLLLLLVMYVFAVFVLQYAAEELQHRSQEQHSTLSDKSVDSLVSNYGSMIQTVYTLYMTITGGVNWGSVAQPLVEITPILGIMYVLFIAFGLLCVLNIVTGVFVENTYKMNQRDDDQMAIEEIDNQKRWCQEVTRLFKLGATETSSMELNYQEFKRLVTDVKMQAILRRQFDLDVDSESAGQLFQMFDLDGSGKVDLDEFVLFVQRFHGNAKSLDLARLLHEQRGLRRDIDKLIGAVSDVARRQSFCKKGSDRAAESQDTIGIVACASTELSGGDGPPEWRSSLTT